MLGYELAVQGVDAEVEILKNDSRLGRCPRKKPSLGRVPTQDPGERKGLDYHAVRKKNHGLQIGVPRGILETNESLSLMHLRTSKL